VGRLLFCSVSVKVVVELGLTVVGPLRLSDVALDDEVEWQVQPDVVCPEMPLGYAQAHAANPNNNETVAMQRLMVRIVLMVKH